MEIHQSWMCCCPHSSLGSGQHKKGLTEEYREEKAFSPIKKKKKNWWRFNDLTWKKVTSLSPHALIIEIFCKPKLRNVGKIVQKWDLFFTITQKDFVKNQNY